MTSAASSERPSRRRVGGLVVVLLAVGAVVGAAVFAFRGEDTPDTLSLAGADEPETTVPADPAVADDGDDESESSDADPPADEGVDTGSDGDAPDASGDTEATVGTVEVVAGTRTDLPASALFDASTLDHYDTRVLPWQGGFLMTGTVAQAQALPELPPEIAERFPDEVITFFEEAGGLPPTINEAIAMLSAEPGLMEMVNDVVANDPEVSEAIYSAPAPAPERFALVSADGVEWSDVEIDWPESNAYDQGFVASDGETLAHASIRMPMGPPPDDSLTEFTAVISTTTDLVTWTSSEFTLDAGVDTSVPDGISLQRHVAMNGLALNAERWIASYEVHQYLDTWSLLPDEAHELMNGSPGTSMSEDEDGISIWTVADDDPVGSPEDADVLLTYTWEELGVEGYSQIEQQPSTGFIVGEVGSSSPPIVGEPSGDPSVSFGLAGLVSADGGFVRATFDGVQASTDGLTWTPLLADQRFVSLVESPIGPIALTLDLDALRADPSLDRPPTKAFLIDVATATTTPVPAPDVSVAGGWSHLGAGAIVYSAPSQQENAVSVEKDGYLIEITFRDFVSEHLVTELADGTVVLDVTTWWGDEDGPVRATDEGWSFEIDGRTEPLLLSHEELWNLEEESFTEPETWVEPELRLLATDGERWVDELLVEEQTIDNNEAQAWDPRREVRAVASADGVVVVVFGDGSVTRIEV